MHLTRHLLYVMAIILRGGAVSWGWGGSQGIHINKHEPWEERTLNHIIYGTIYSKLNIIRDDFIPRFTRDNLVGLYMKPSWPRHIYSRFGYDNHTTRKIQREIFVKALVNFTKISRNFSNKKQYWVRCQHFLLLYTTTMARFKSF